jgi:hypothetical protein
MDADRWFRVVGLISVSALSVGFVAGIVSLGLSWKINRDEKQELAKIKADAQVEAQRIESEGKDRVAKIHAEAEKQTRRIEAESQERIARIQAAANEKIAEANKQAARANERAGNLELEAAAQRERAANAELALKRAREQLQPRSFTFDFASFKDALKNQPKGTVFILYDGDTESLLFASGLSSAFREVGWKTTGPAPHTEIRFNPWGLGPNESNFGVTLISRLIEGGGATIKADTPYRALTNAFRVAKSGIHQRVDATVPPDAFGILIAQQPWINRTNKGITNQPFLWQRLPEP